MSFYNIVGAVAARGLDANADSVSGALFYVFTAGTTTAVTTYTDKTGATANASPVVANAAGAFGGIFVAAGTYKVDLRTSAGASLPGYPIDNIRIETSTPTEIATRSALVAFDFEGDAPEFIETRGFATVGDGGEWLYKSVAGAPAAPAISIASADGEDFEAVVSTEINAAITGFGGTGDQTSSLQDAIDAGIYTYKVPVKVQAGSFEITHAHISYGDTFRSGELHGAGRKYRGEDNFTGTALVGTNYLVPMVNFQGSRNSAITNMTLVGPAKDVLLNYYEVAGKNDRELLDIDNWYAALTAGGFTDNNRTNSPSAGVTIGAYSDPEPATPYDDVVYPSYGGSGQYNKSLDSAVRIQDVMFYGHENGVVVGPNNNQQNDFVRLRDVAFDHCVVCLSVGGDQARSTTLNTVDANRCHTLVATNKHGPQDGRIDALFMNTVVGNMAQIWDRGVASSGGTITFSNMYAEALGRLGNHSGTNEQPSVSVVLEDSNIIFNDNSTDGFVEGAVLTGTTNDRVILEDTSFRSEGPISFGRVPVDIRRSRVTTDAPTKAYQVIGLNCLSGGLCPDPLQNPAFFAAMRAYSISSPGSVDDQGVHGMDLRLTGRDYLIPHGVSSGMCETAGEFSGKLRPIHVTASSKLSSVSRTDRAITFTHGDISGSVSDLHYRRAIVNGAVWIERDTGTICFMRSVDYSTGVCVMEMMNNYYNDGVNYQILNSFDPAAVTWYCINPLTYAPAKSLTGTLTSGSAVITNVRDFDNITPLTNFGLTVGDRFADLHYNQPSLQLSNSRLAITAIDTSARTITLSGSGFTHSADHVPLNFWWRQPPANEASR